MNVSSQPRFKCSIRFNSIDPEVFDFSGEPCRIRTCDPLIKSLSGSENRHAITAPYEAGLRR